MKLPRDVAANARRFEPDVGNYQIKVKIPRMHFRQFYLGCLAHASYLIGSGSEAAVVDPQRDIEIYLEEAKAHGFVIKYVIETHCHADFISGHHELAARTGAKIYFGARAAAKFPFVPVHEGDDIVMADVTLGFLETPGHNPESISILVFDRQKSSTVPEAVLTGDTMFKSWRGIRRNLPLASVEQISVEELRQRIEENSVDIILDVRRPKEWEIGHIAQATSMPLNHLAESAVSLNRDAKIAAVCAGGYRSSIATSLLEQLGFRNISNVVGGMTAWNNAKLAFAS